MTRTISSRFGWPGLLALAWIASAPAAHAWGPNPPMPIATDCMFVWRFDVKCGPSAFARPAGPWYTYFPVDPNLLAQPRAAAYPNWPTQYPPSAMGPPPGLTYYNPLQASPYAYGVYPAGYYANGPYWYPR
jgi:hypothetical protein